MNSARVLLVVTIGGLTATASAVPADGPKNATSGEAAEGPFHKAVLKVAADYKGWGRVDDVMRWAPLLCRSTVPSLPGKVYVSASQNEATHGRKLYSIFVRQSKSYADLEKSADPVTVGQVVVKQSWEPEEITDPEQRPERQIDVRRIIRTPAPQPDSKHKDGDDGFDYFYPYVWKGDKVFRAAKQADLFIMMKLDPKTPDTDNGWVYATTTPDGKRVTAAGRIESCINCHQEAKKDRLFGLVK